MQLDKLKIGQRVYMVPSYGTIQSGILGTVTGVERDEQDKITAVLIQPPFSTSVYLDLRDEGFTVLDATFVAPPSRKSQQLSC